MAVNRSAIPSASTLTSPEVLTDQALVELAKKDREAFAMIYRRHVTGVYRYAYRLCGGDKAVAEDVTSSTFERAMAAIDRFEWRGGGLRPWLYRIASAEVATWYRHHERTTGAKGQQAAKAFQREVTGFDDWFSSAGTANDRSDQVLRALSELHPRYRDAIAMRYLADMSAEEAAEAMECSKGTLAVMLHRALAALRRELDQGRANGN